MIEIDGRLIPGTNTWIDRKIHDINDYGLNGDCPTLERVSGLTLYHRSCNSLDGDCYQGSHNIAALINQSGLYYRNLDFSRHFQARAGSKKVTYEIMGEQVVYAIQFLAESPNSHDLYLGFLRDSFGNEVGRWAAYQVNGDGAHFKQFVVGEKADRFKPINRDQELNCGFFDEVEVHAKGNEITRMGLKKDRVLEELVFPIHLDNLDLWLAKCFGMSGFTDPNLSVLNWPEELGLKYNPRPRHLADLLEEFGVRLEELE